MSLEAGGEDSWEFVEPNRLLAHVVEKCPAIAETYARAANESMPTRENPWGLLLCFDEFVPGDKLTSYSTRKTMVLAYKFKQLGEEVLPTITRG